MVWDVLVQPDGKIVIGHRTVTRFDSDGSLDINFDAGVGTGASHNVVALARQADGKLIAGGNFTSFSGSSLNRVVRLDTDGSIDLTFDPGTGITGSATPQVLTCLVQPDGRIVLGGTFTHYDDNPSQHLVRVESDGSWDATFVPGTILGNVQRVVRQTDGRLLLAGTFTSIGGEVRERLARLEPDGALDPAFVPSVGNAPGDMALQHDGAIMRVGTFSQVNDTFWSRIGRVHGDWYVTWGDGEGGALTVEIPLLSSGTGTSSTLEFELYDPQGGAALGSVAAHTLTIIDEDAPGDPGNEERGGCASVAHVDWGCTLLLAALTLLLVARRRLG